MSGKLIKDRAFWAGGAGKDAVLPDGAKSKAESSADGAGALGRYEDTTEAIKSQQVSGKGQIKARPLKAGTRY